MSNSRLAFFLFVLFFSFQGLSDNHQEQWSKSRFIEHLSDSKRTSVANFSEKLDNIWKRLREERLSEMESLKLESEAKRLQAAQEIFLRTVQKYKKELVGDALDKAKELTTREIREAKKHDKLIGMYQANISELESVLEAIQKHIHSFQK